MSDNRYNSTTRTFLARNVLGPKTLPADISAGLVLAEADWLTQLVYWSPDLLNENSNLIVRRAGVFCNFADGLVFENQHERFDLSFEAVGISIPTTPLTGDASTLALNDKTMVGTGTSWDTDLAAGDIIRLIRTATPQRRQYALVDSVTDATNAELRDFPRIATAAADVKVSKASVSSTSDTAQLLNIDTFNTMYDLDWFVNPQSVEDLTDLAIKVSVNQDIAAEVDGHAMGFLTNSISSDFAEKSVWIDVALECEVTLATGRN